MHHASDHNTTTQRQRTRTYTHLHLDAKETGQVSRDAQHRGALSSYSELLTFDPPPSWETMPWLLSMRIGLPNLLVCLFELDPTAKHLGPPLEKVIEGPDPPL